MNNKMSEQDLFKKVDELPTEMVPERDLWLGIERAIQGKQQSDIVSNSPKKILPMAWAASVVAAVLVTWLSFSPSPQISQPSVNLVAEMRQNFNQQKQAMLVNFGQPQISQLPKEMQEQLAQLASARQSIETALLSDVNNSDLLNLLRWTQKQELELIKQLYSPQWQSI